MPGRSHFEVVRRSRGLVVLLVCCFCLLWLSGASAQTSNVQMNIEGEFLGIGGVVQRGVWNPVRVDLTNVGAENVEVTCRWLLSDEDGDQLIAEREQITLAPNRTQGVWLYAVPPMSTRPGQLWQFQVVASGGELLNQVDLQLDERNVVKSSVKLVGMCGYKGLGLNPWLRWSTQHEQLRLIRGLNIETLPDRWYGLDGLSTLIWYDTEGGQPTAARMSDSTKRALREWVYRGGHLVLVLPYAGQQWTSADSGLADLIAPLTAADINQVSARPPIQVFGVLRSNQAVPMLTFDLSGAAGYTSVADVQLPAPGGSTTAPPGATPVNPNPNATPATAPLIVAKRFGFGQVTLVGIDLSDPAVLTSLDSFRMSRVWTRITNWRGSKNGELLPTSLLDGPSGNQFREAKDAQNQVELGAWVAPQVARQRETGPAVGLAFILFVVYAVAAALTFPNLLRTKGWERHSWVLFVGVVALFSVVAWGGAWLIRPSSSSAAHFTVLDIDGNTNTVRARSWQSVLIPKFTTADIAVPTDAAGLEKMDVVNLIASPGHDLTPESPGYPDRRTYAYDAADPNRMDIPMRSTTKNIFVDYLGPISAPMDGLKETWTLPNASLAIGANGLPTGTLTHSFPDELVDVTIVYCPGGAQTPGRPTDARPAGRPLVYAYKNANNQSVWPAKQPIALPSAAAAYQPLWLRPRMNANDRPWTNEGFLGQQIHGRQFSDQSTAANANAITRDTALLSFFDALPPPKYEIANIGNQFVSLATDGVYSRSLMRDLDLTPLLSGRRLIVIGHLRKSPSPVPMTVDGDAVDSEGWTVVRWIYDF